MPIGFLHLPGEIRNPIYKHLLVSSEPIEICVCTGDLRRTTPKFPRDRRWELDDSEDDNDKDCLCLPPRRGTSVITAILVANRQIHAEANALFYSANHFVVFTSKTSTLSTFLDRIGRQNAGLIRHLSIPFPHVRLKVQLEECWSSDDEESPAGPPSVQDYESVKNDAEFRISNPAVLDMISQQCTGLQTLETVVGTAQRPNRNVEMIHDGQLIPKAMQFLDSRLRDGIPSLKNIFINLYMLPWAGPERMKRWRMWESLISELGWTPEYHWVEARPQVVDNRHLVRQDGGYESSDAEPEIRAD